MAPWGTRTGRLTLKLHRGPPRYLLREDAAADVGTWPELSFLWYRWEPSMETEDLSSALP